MWELAVNMLSKQVQITDRWWYAELEFGQRIVSPQVENQRAKNVVSVLEFCGLLQL